MLSLYFFFKQKTAYEMRISDWSSDVCSSDLQAVPGAGSARRRRSTATARRCLTVPPAARIAIRSLRSGGPQLTPEVEGRQQEHQDQNANERRCRDADDQRQEIEAHGDQGRDGENTVEHPNGLLSRSRGATPARLASRPSRTRPAIWRSAAGARRCRARRSTARRPACR